MGMASLMQVVCIILIMFPFTFTTTVYALPDFQVVSLKAFKMALTADPQLITSTWDTTQDNPCEWFHFTCNPNKFVTRIDLGGAQLEGPLVPDLGNLTSLTHLNLYSNRLTGQIPPELGNLTSLQKRGLGLYNNKLSGPVPVELSKLPPGAIDIANNPGLCGNLADPPRKC